LNSVAEQHRFDAAPASAPAPAPAPIWNGSQYTYTKATFFKTSISYHKRCSNFFLVSSLDPEPSEPKPVPNCVTVLDPAQPK
jgi:hypothetical protein